MPASLRSLATILPFPAARHVALLDIEHVEAERRQKFRYPLDLCVRFCSSRAGTGLSGEGTIVNMSSGGVLIASSQQPLVGELVEMRIEWPSLLHGRVPLQLIALGRILRCAPARFAAAFERYEFRTVKRSAQA